VKSVRRIVSSGNQKKEFKNKTGLYQEGSVEKYGIIHSDHQTHFGV